MCDLDVDRTRAVQKDDNRAFNGRKRTVFTPNRWTELFFLDEFVAFAAGHRPCACCRRADYKAFLEAWSAAMGPRKEPWTAPEIDQVLHAERLDARTGKKRLHDVPGGDVSKLPDGCMVTLPRSEEVGDDARGNDDDDAWLVWQGALHRWTHDGYVREPIPCGGVDAFLLTPPSLVATIAAGFAPGPPHASLLGSLGTS